MKLYIFGFLLIAALMVSVREFCIRLNKITFHFTYFLEVLSTPVNAEDAKPKEAVPEVAPEAAPTGDNSLASFLKSAVVKGAGLINHVPELSFIAHKVSNFLNKKEATPSAPEKKAE